MTVMPDHAPVITTLRPGVLRVESASGATEYVVTGGFAEIRADSASVLAEKAIPVSEVTRAQIDDMVAILREGISRTMDDLRREGLWQG